MIPEQITTPPVSTAASITAVTENTSEPGSAAYNFGTASDNEFQSDDSDKNSVKSDKKKTAKQWILDQDIDEDMSLTEDGQISDDKPVILEAEEESDQKSDAEEEVVYLGTAKPPNTTTLTTAGNINKNMTITYCVGNVNFGKAYGHFMMLSNGLDQNGSPRHNFRNFLLEIYVRNGKFDWVFLY